jgi:circadian clock protein KaiB
MAKRAAKRVLRLRLYVAGDAPNSATAIANIQAICSEHFAERHEIEIVDMTWHPHRAMEDDIIVTPTLLKLLPMPLRRVVGNLSDREQVLMVLKDD